MGVGSRREIQNGGMWLYPYIGVNLDGAVVRRRGSSLRRSNHDRGVAFHGEIVLAGGHSSGVRSR